MIIRSQKTSRPGQPVSPPDWARRFQALAEASSHPVLRHFYGKGAVEADTPLASTPFAGLDLETTGLDAQQHGIVSIGVVPFTLDRIFCRQGRYWVVRPRRDLEQGSIMIHQLTHATVSDAPDLEEILAELLASLAGRVVVVHYRGIERRFLRRAVTERLGEPLEFPVVDTMEIEARLHRGIGRSRPVRWFRKLMGGQSVSLRLAESRKRYHLPDYSPHHAFTDALASAELLQAQVAHHFSPPMPIAKLWC